MVADRITSNDRSAPGSNAVDELLQRGAHNTPEAAAIAAPGRPPLTWAGLWKQVVDTRSSLQAAGLGPDDRVAFVLPNGPDLAVAFLALISGMACAPLNPTLREEEYRFHLSDVKASALIVPRLDAGSAVRSARELGLPVIELSPHDTAGVFDLHVPALERKAPEPPGARAPDSLALLLHTSGTTSRPKLVPLTQASLCLSAGNVARSLALTPQDRCLSIMPLFHIHGLVAGLLAPLSAGGSVACAPQFEAPQFWAWVDEMQPTWYTAVPTMHQSIVARAAASSDIIAHRPLRFIRSCSAALPPPLLKSLESELHAPVIEAYGMTEAAHQIACNPLPPGRRKVGSVGVATGPQVAIMDDTGALLPPGTIGEIVLCGPSIIAGYENNPQANAASVHNGWFRTGDLGRLDGEGYLFIQGRTKEIINRSGEKISPREVEEVLLTHPAVAQAVVFAAPHSRLGEEVAAAIVLGEPVQADERELRLYAAERLADFKVPTRMVFLDELPRGPTGKLQRVGLAERLGMRTDDTPDEHAPIEYVAPRTDLERTIAAIWAEVLGVERVGVNDEFLDVGGDSILAARVISRVRASIEYDLPLVCFFETPTIAGLAALIEEQRGESH